MVLNLTIKPEFSRKLTTAFMLAAVIGGLIYYGVGFAEITGNLLLSVIRTPMCVIRMFIGVNELSAIQGSTLVSTDAGLILFWLIHLLAFYSMASAAMITIGAAALRYLRFLLARRGDLTLIYGINESSISLGKECLAAGEKSVVYVAEQADPETVNTINSLGMSVILGAAAVASEKAVLRRLRVRRRKLTVYALNPVEDQNLFYALRMKDSLEKAGVPAEKTRVTLPGAVDILTPMLQVSDTQYGFGYVNVFDSADLTARALIQTCPPWKLVSFDRDGRCLEDFDCVIAGFGRHGQAVLKSLVMNGQFAGACFHAAVFSPGVESQAGYLEADSPYLWKEYDIRRFDADARSVQFYNYLEKKLQTLKMIAVCTGSEEMNREISDSLMLFLKRKHAQQICVVQCGESGVRYQETVGSPIIQTGIYTRSFLSAEKADRLAILLNSTYDTSDRSDWDKWVACDSFGKMSSRASADFIPAFIHASGSSREEILKGRWNPDKNMLAVLGETEHMRWCAFHYAMGYSPMRNEEFERNAAEYIRLQKAGIPCSVKIAKNADARTHACLIPWEELDALSERENSVTGRNVDYKQLDINNVLALPKLLKTADAEEKTPKTRS